MANKGFIPISQFKSKPRLMLGIEGLPDTGKTEFSLTAPPGIGVLAIDRGYEHVVSKAEPPKGRQSNISLCVFPVPQPGQDPGKAEGNTYKTIWDEFYGMYKQSITNPAFRTVVIDGDSDTWELQQLASFGKITQVPPLQRTDVNAARRVMIARGFDSGKNIIFTYRVKAEYENVIKINSQGQPTEVGERTGEYKRAGFSDHDYCVQVQIRTLYNPAHTDPKTGKSIQAQFGFRIVKCKPDMSLVGYEGWGDECNFSGLVMAIYPEADLSEWGL